ncbi:MAG: bifunctional UDP-N-acetylglucosamine diphosphorylase/glucosamine-1-phosphate N-acetyltransferase GlmU [Bryobacteraceae bacterium]|nr:bifunctional UDP-N-acetylglucosamine diphosphorylase/glucosamine-1-phosphate N-acetyltransferase GlmU [Bryobacteraceae bacterium]
MSAPLTVAILAAGLGTRMKSKKAKVLHRVGGLALAEHVVRRALELTSPDRVCVVTGHQADDVETLLSRYGVRFVRQLEQLGTGHALFCSRPALEPSEGLLLVLYGDTPLLSRATLERLVAAQQDNEYTGGTLITTEPPDPTGYGRILRDTEGNVRAIVEERVATEEERKIRQINSGIYCFRSRLLWKHLAEIRPNSTTREVFLTDIVEVLANHGYAVGALPVADSSELLGINTRVELAAADTILRRRKAEQLMLAGVTIEKPETVTIDAEVEVGQDTLIEPFAQLLGATRIGSDCRIGACSIVQDSVLADRVELLPFTMVNTSHLAEDVHVGPYARLRLENHLAAGARVGNFVELKKTRVGPGSKALHLAYLGDASIGAAANIGAGTITCNYDGAAKHATSIGDGCFVGSNATLVAPLSLGSGSYVGAGSVITNDVPPKALGLGRSKQVVKDGWVEARKKKS